MYLDVSSVEPSLSSVGRVEELVHVPASVVAAPAEPRIFSSSSRDRVIRPGADLPYSTQVGEEDSVARLNQDGLKLSSFCITFLLSP